MRWGGLFAISCCLFAACATATIPTEDDASTGGDSSVPKDGSAADVAKPNDAGTCNSPTTKCVTDAGPVCVDTKTDIDHCGQCTTACTTADAGSLQPGPNNPDAGIGPYDGGIGWTLGTPGCDASNCAVTCPQGFTECSDGICYDPQNFHDHCGNCTTACQSTEWCTQGKCCSVGTKLCNGNCVDTTSDKNNCGSCGNVCGSGKPVCSGGQCVSAVTFSQAFVSGQIATSQCTAWTTFRSQLTGTYSSITISGTNDTVGRTCSGAGANTLCQALHNNTSTSVSCGGFTWVTDQCTGGIELTADNGTCSCTNPGYNVRPCLNTNGDWGGVNTKSCAAPSQTITVMCQ
jgi:hypothetical protein